MASDAEPFQFFAQRHLPRGMRVFMAAQAFQVVGAMRRGVTGRTLGHESRIVVSQWVIGMKRLMTFTAVKAVLPPHLFEVGERLRMTLTALVNS